MHECRLLSGNSAYFLTFYTRFYLQKYTTFSCYWVFFGSFMPFTMSPVTLSAVEIELQRLWGTEQFLGSRDLLNDRTQGCQSAWQWTQIPPGLRRSDWQTLHKSWAHRDWADWWAGWMTWMCCLVYFQTEEKRKKKKNPRAQEVCIQPCKSETSLPHLVESYTHWLTLFLKAGVNFCDTCTHRSDVHMQVGAQTSVHTHPQTKAQMYRHTHTPISAHTHMQNNL